MDQTIITFLTRNTWSSFYASCLAQYHANGMLSPRQVECIQAAMLKASQPAPRRESILKVGQRFEIKAWLARRLATELNLKTFFRNLEVIEVIRETNKAIQVKVRFVSQIVTNCHICGRALDHDISRATGIGPICAVKIGLPRPTMATAQDTLKAIDELCATIGSIGPIWVPKSQIKLNEGES